MSELRLFAVLLAAGASTRYGAVKQLAAYRGQPLVAHAMREAEAVCAERTLLVTGYEGAAVYRAAAPLSGFRVHNDHFADGLAASIACAVRAVSGAADGVLLMLADQPLVDRRHLAALARRWHAAPQHYVASAYAGHPGVPAIFPAAAFAELRTLRGDSGARRLLREAGARLSNVSCEAAAVDVDRPADLAALGEGGD